MAQISLMLVEGAVAVSPVAEVPDPTKEEPKVLTTGQRLTLIPRENPTVDQPEVERVTAWRRGRVEFVGTPLSEAIRELNRYSDSKLAVAQSEAGTILVTGSFRATDAESFAQSVAISCGLTVVDRPQRILLSGLPSSDCR